jgi:hypothetical protein
MSTQRKPDKRAPIIETVDYSLLPTLDAEIEEFERLPPNWNGDDALPISRPVITESKILLRLITDKALAKDIGWRSPSVAPNPDGGIDFTWDCGERWVSISIVPEEESLECVTQQAGESPVFRVVPRVEAIEAALWAMSG